MKFLKKKPEKSFELFIKDFSGIDFETKQKEQLGVQELQKMQG